MRTLRPGLISALMGISAVLTAPSASLHAEIHAQSVVENTNPEAQSIAVEAPKTADLQKFSTRAAIRAIIEQETAKTKLPPDVAEAVVFVESRYDATVVGLVGEIGLMQVRPETAAMLGFRGSTPELAKPEINIHYGVTYLSKAWRIAEGDLCRALMKYRAGHGEESMTPRSVIYCNRARNRLVAMGSPFAATGALATIPPATIAPVIAPTDKFKSSPTPGRPMDVYTSYKRGTPAASRAFWAAHEVRIRAIKAQIESKRRRVASR